MRKILILAIVFVSIQSIAQQNKPVTMVVKQDPPVETVLVVDVENEPAFIVVEDPATFNGGDVLTFRNWVQENINFADSSISNVEENRVVVQFIVNKLGYIQDEILLRPSALPVLNVEILRVVSSSPKWKPAQQGGTCVNQKFTIPVVIKS